MKAPSSQIGPRSAGKILDLAFNIYFKNLGRLVGAAAVIAAPLGLITIGLSIAAYAEPGAFTDIGLVDIGSTTREVDYDRFLVLNIVNTVVVFVGYLVILGTTFGAANDAFIGRPILARESIRGALRRFHSLLWISFLTTVAVILGLLALLVGAVFAIVLLAVAIPALMVEGLRGFKACRRSLRLIENNGTRTFAVLLVAAAFTALLQVLAGLAGEAATALAADHINLYVVIAEASGAVALALTAPFTAVVATVIYYDLRIRKEGLDVDLMIDALPEPPGPTAGLGPPPGGPAIPQAPRPYPGPQVS